MKKFSTSINNLKTLLFLMCFTFIVSSCLSPKSSQKNTLQKTLDYNSETFDFFQKDAYKIPNDIIDSTQTALCRFAWKEFIALNWPSNYTTKRYTRGVPDSTKTVVDFLKIAHTGNLVWQTYKHSSELFPEDTTQFNKNFNHAPMYTYKKQNLISAFNNIPENVKLHEIQTIFTNLDESTQNGLCSVFVDGDSNTTTLSKSPRRILYEKKTNLDFFEYVKEQQLYDKTIREKKIKHTIASYKTKKNNNFETIEFPHGDINDNQGSIEIKAAWRQLTLEEYNSHKFITAPIIRYRKKTPSNSKIYYEIVASEPTYRANELMSLPYGLVGLHIIHKTKNYPSSIFATFEHIDNLNDNKPNNNLFYYNTTGNTKKQFAYRANPILKETKKVNDSVHAQIRKQNSKSVWQYYQLVGVQGKPQNTSHKTDYFLSNTVLETNEIMRSFTGFLDPNSKEHMLEKNNVFKENRWYNQGGIKGFYGNIHGTDFSLILPKTNQEKPETIDDSL